MNWDSQMLQVLEIIMTHSMYSELCLFTEEPATQVITLNPSASASTVTVKLNAVKWKAIDSSNAHF